MCGISAWLEHVPSGANIAGLPSRADFALLAELGSKSSPCNLVWPDIGAPVGASFLRLWRMYARTSRNRDRAHAAGVAEAVADAHAGRPPPAPSVESGVHSRTRARTG